MPSKKTSSTKKATKQSTRKKSSSAKSSRSGSLKSFTPSDGPLSCHFVSNTHWDREWQYSFQRTRYMLVYLMDMLLDIFEKEPRYKHFVLDSQTSPLQDYLEMRPERTEQVRQYVENGRLVVGPWFTLPDVNIVGPESLIRNLLLGHKIANEFGAVSKTGYSPFSWGQVSQMPQIYKGFGIELMAFYRGVNTSIAPRSEYIWEAPDGTQVVGSRLGFRPRYNVWYLIQRAAFWNVPNVNDRNTAWGEGHGPFRMINMDKRILNAIYTHPAYEYHTDRLKQQCDIAIEEQNDDWTTPHRFWGNGHDWSCPDIREAQLVEDCNEALGEQGEVLHSTFKAFQDGVLAHKDKRHWPVYKGEMRKHPLPDWKAGPLMSNCLSARVYIKQDNYNTERMIGAYAEPLAVFASLLGAPYPQAFVDFAYNMLLQNHGHDSVGSCCRDTPHRDMLYRSRQAREVSECMLERAMVDIAGAIDLSHLDKDDMAIVVYNPAPFEREEIVKVSLDIPREWGVEAFTIVDEKGKALDYTIDEVEKNRHHYIQTPHEVQTLMYSDRYTVNVAFPKVPGMGYRTFFVQPVREEVFPPMPESMVTGPQGMANEHVEVFINANGTLDIAELDSGEVFEDLCYFRDSGDAGDPWYHKPPTHQQVFTTLNESAEIALVKDTPLECQYQITIDWSLPEDILPGDTGRSPHKKVVKIVNTVTLRKGQRWVDVVTEVDNTVKNHWFQLALPTGVETRTVSAQSHFDVIERPIAASPDQVYAQEFHTEHPMNSFLDVSDGEGGVAFLGEGLKSYEALDDPDTTICISLIRSAPLRLGWSKALDHSSYEEDIQMLGKQRFHYALMPHAGNWEKAGIWQAAEAFNLEFQAGQLAPTDHGREPLSRSFLELTPSTLHVSAVKKSEDGKGWIVRLFNPLGKTVKAGLRLNGGIAPPSTQHSPVERVQAEFVLPPSKRKWKAAEQVTLEEKPEKKLTIDSSGRVSVSVPKKRIVTIKFSA